MTCKRCYRTKNILARFLASPQIVCDTIDEPKRLTQKEPIMNYQTLLTNATEWTFATPTNFALVIGIVVVIGCIKGAFSLRYHG